MVAPEIFGRDISVAGSLGACTLPGCREGQRFLEFRPSGCVLLSAAQHVLGSISSRKYNSFLVLYPARYAVPGKVLLYPVCFDTTVLDIVPKAWTHRNIELSELSAYRNIELSICRNERVLWGC